MGRVELSQQYESALGCAPLVRVNGKAPLDPQWSTGPRRDPALWRDRLADHHGNVGLLTGSGLFVVDVDLYHPGAQDALDDLCDLGLQRETVTALTGGGGIHLYFRTPVPIASRPLPGYPGIDIKGEGGQCVVPPSVHLDSGRVYVWEDGYAPDEIEMATPPAHLLELLAGEHAAGYAASGDLDERDEEAVDLLLDHFGAHSPSQRAQHIELTRPGKARGVSVTVGYVGRGVAKVWTPNWPSLPAGVYDLRALRKLAGVPEPAMFSVKEAPTDELPAGYRLWEPRDDAVPDPVLGRAAYHGPVGDYLDLLKGQTEAHPAAIGIQVLAGLGTVIGRGAAYRAGRVVHHCNLFAAVVGLTSEGGKGVADAEAFALVGPFLSSRMTMGGIGSGEALIRALADDQDPPAETRKIVHDAELSAVLKVVRRDGSILGDIIRKCFDYGPLHHMTVTHKHVIATGHHVAVVGSITPTELRSLVDEMAIASGFANRFLYVWSRLTECLPRGGTVDAAAVGHVADQITRALATLDSRNKINGSAHLKFSPAGGECWDTFYMARRRGIGDGIARTLNARHVAHAARLALIYAVLDGSVVIDRAHVEAAIAWCDYSAASVEKVFGSAAGGKAGLLLDAIRAAMPDGMFGTQIHAGLAHHWKPGELAEVRKPLLEQHLVHVLAEGGTGGRARERYIALTPTGGTGSKGTKGADG